MELAPLVHAFDLLPELGQVTAAEFGEISLATVIPAPQFVRRREMLWPGIDLQFAFGQAAGPQSVDQNAQAIVGTVFVVGALDPDRRAVLGLARRRTRGNAALSRLLHRCARLRTPMSSPTLRRCSRLSPLAMACSTQCATWSARISSSARRNAARTAEICVTMSMQ